MRLVLTIIKKVKENESGKTVTFADGITILTHWIGSEHEGDQVIRFDDTDHPGVGVARVRIEGRHILFLEHLCGNIGVGLVDQFEEGDSAPLGLLILQGLVIQESRPRAT